MKLKAPPLRRARIEIVPMIDTIFFLLVFFMISTLSMVKLKGINLSLPRPAVQGDTRPTGNILVLIDDAGQISLNKSPVAIKDLPDRFAAVIKSNPRGAVVLKVSDAQKTQALVSTMDLLNEAIAEAKSSNPVIVATEAAKGAPNK